MAPTYSSLRASASLRAWWSTRTWDHNAECGEGSLDHGFGLPAKSSGVTMRRLLSSFLMLVCLLEKMSASTTTLASRPLALWIVITLTASPGGMVMASRAPGLRSLRSRILSARTIASPPTSAASDLMTSMICSTSCRETESG